jgi:3-methyladenine DNA glycosylase AlkD
MDTGRATSNILRDLRSVRVRTVPALRPIRRKWSKEVASASPQEVLQVARDILASDEAEFRFIAYELVHFHKPARKSLRKGEVEGLAHGMQSWDAVDAFSYYISGPAWRDGRISDDVIAKWAASNNRWWRRAALASTIPLSRRHTAEDIARVLSVCALLVADRDDMVVKAMSWALREVARQNPSAATRFVDAHGDALAPRVLREVRNKLQTGLKNPRKKIVRT